MKRVLQFVILVCLWNYTNAQSIEIAGWDFNGLSNYGNSPLSPTSSNSNTTITGLTRGAGLATSGTAAANAWGGTGYTVSSTTEAAAISGGDSIIFKVKSNVYYNLSLDSIGQYNIRRSGTGPTTGQWAYSINGGTYTNIGTAITWGSTTSAGGNLKAKIDLFGITALQNLPSSSTITFRLLLWGATNTGGTCYLNNFGAASTNDLRIWGKINCGDISLAATNKTGLTERCTNPSSGYTYYGDGGGIYFAINKNGNTLTATVDVTVTSGTVDSSKSSNGANQEHASYLMNRYWNVNCGGCNPTTNGGVTVRFFYNPTDTIAARTAMRSGFNALKASNTNTLADTTKAMQWIKNNSGTYSPAFFLGNKASGPHTKLTPIYGSQNGVSYVQFDTVKSFSGGGGGFGYGPPNSGGGVGLPVTWAYFTAQKTDGGNQLNWATASEKNTSHFEIEYSIDGSHFISIEDKIRAAGESANLIKYSFIHNFSAPLIYYRIKQIDLDGLYDYSKTIVLKNKDVSNKNFIKVLPSFIQEQEPLTIEGYEFNMPFVFFEIINGQGQRILSDKIPTIDGYFHHSQSLESYPTGLYFLRVYNSDLNNIYQGKIRK